MTKGERGTRELFGIFRVLRPDKVYKLVIFSDKIIRRYFFLKNNHKTSENRAKSKLYEKFPIETHC